MRCGASFGHAVSFPTSKKNTDGTDLCSEKFKCIACPPVRVKFTLEKPRNCARIISPKCSSIALYQGWLAESFTWLSCDYHVCCDYLQSRFRSYVPPSPHALLRITLNINSNLNTPPLSLHEHLQRWFILTTQKSALVVQSITTNNVHDAGDLCADSHSTTSC